MKLIYIANMRLPTEKAHGLATMKICEAFSLIWFEVELFIPWTLNKLKGNPFDFYRIKRNFKIKKLPSVDFLFLSARGPLRHSDSEASGFALGGNIFSGFFFLLRSFSFSFFALIYFLCLKMRGKLKDAVFFSHDHIPLFFLSFLGLPFVLDIHDFPSKNIFYRRVMKKALGFAVQTKWKVAELGKRFNILPEKIVYWPNGVGIKEFALNISQEEARKRLGILLDPAKSRLRRDSGASKKIALYTGHFFSWKGVDTLALASQYLDDDTLVYFVGGSPEDAKKFETFIQRKKLYKIRLISFQPHYQIPIWLKAADVLVLPNTAKEDISLYYTSPMKLFEYMAARKPIAASDIPSIAEILNEENSVLVKPDDPEALARGIRFVLENNEFAEKISSQAYIDVQKYTWEARAKLISDFIIRSIRILNN